MSTRATFTSVVTESMREEADRIWDELEAGTNPGLRPPGGLFKMTMESIEPFYSSGARKVSDFLQDMQHLFMTDPQSYGLAHPHGHIHRIMAARSFLRGTARIWYSNQYNTWPRPDCMYNWHAFERAMISDLDRPFELARQEALDELANLKQAGEYRDICAYRTRCRQLTLRVGLWEEDAQDFYERGLSEKNCDNRLSLWE